MATVIAQMSHLHNSSANPNHDPSLTAQDDASTAHHLAAEERVRSPSPAFQAQHDDDADLDTRKHMEAPRNPEGRIVCLRSGCESMRFDRKCEWSKHMDKHDRPYKCQDAACVKLKGFTYSGGLLRHQREVHKQHGGQNEEMNCPIPFCKRNTGPGFTRKENLQEHIRRVHRQPPREVVESAQSKRRDRRGGRRRSADPEQDVAIDAALIGDQGSTAPQAQMLGQEDQHGQLDKADPYRQSHPYQPSTALPNGQVDNSLEHAGQTHQQQAFDQAQHPAVPPDFQVGMVDAREYEMACLRQENERLKHEMEEKDQKIARLEATLTSLSAVQQAAQDADSKEATS